MQNVSYTGNFQFLRWAFLWKKEKKNFFDCFSFSISPNSLSLNIFLLKLQRKKRILILIQFVIRNKYTKEKSIFRGRKSNARFVSYSRLIEMLFISFCLFNSMSLFLFMWMEYAKSVLLADACEWQTLAFNGLEFIVD